LTDAFEARALAPLEDDAIGLVIAGETNIQNRENPASAFDPVRGVFDRADLRICHLEGLLATPSDDPERLDIPHKPLWRHSGPAMVEALTAAGVDAVSCASNVSYPRHDVLESARVLTDAGIAFAGVGATLSDARRPAVVESKGVRVAVLSYTCVFWPYEHAAEEHRPGTAVLRAVTAYRPGRRALEMPGAPPEIVTFLPPEEIAVLGTDVRAAKAGADIVVLSCHWGVSSSPEPLAYQTELARAAIDAGADAVIGHHPHVLQPVAFHDGRPIFYSMGNFIFDWPNMRGRNRDGILLRLDISDGRIRRIRVVPAQRDEHNEIAILDPSGSEGAEIMDRLRRMSEGDVVFAKGPTGVELSPA